MKCIQIESFFCLKNREPTEKIPWNFLEHQLDRKFGIGSHGLNAATSAAPIVRFLKEIYFSLFSFSVLIY